MMTSTTGAALLAFVAVSVGNDTERESQFVEAQLKVAASAGQDEDRGVAIAERIDAILMLIETEEGWGSGFLYGDTKTVITNRHVILPHSESEDPIGKEVSLYPTEKGRGGFVRTGSEPLQGTVRWVHASQDLAVIELDSSFKGIPLEVKPDQNGQLRPRGTEAWAHGVPFIIGTPAISKGIITAHRKDPFQLVTYYVSDVAIDSGSSGGPVTDGDGFLIGVATASYFLTEGGQQWAGLIPAREVEAMFPRGNGVGGLPAPLMRQSQLAGIRTCRDLDRKMALSIGLMREVVEQSVIPDKICATYLECMRAFTDNAELGNADEYVAFWDFYAQVDSMVLAGVEFVTMTIGTASTKDGCAAWEEAREIVETWEAGQSVIDLLFRSPTTDLVDSVAENVALATQGLSAQGTLLEAYRMAANENYSRLGFSQEDVRTALTGVYSAEWALSFANWAHEKLMESPKVRLSIFRTSPVFKSITSLKEALADGQARWDEIPIQVRARFVGLKPDETTVWIAECESYWQEGGSLQENGWEENQLKPEETWDIPVEMILGEFPFSVCAYSHSPQTDIDLYIYGPSGELYAMDDEWDSYPIASEVDGPPGIWSVQIKNAGADTCKVNLNLYWH